MAKTQIKTQIENENQFSKEQFLNSKSFDDKDLINALIGKNEQISIEELNSRIEKFMKSEVK